VGCCWGVVSVTTTTVGVVVGATTFVVGAWVVGSTTETAVAMRPVDLDRSEKHACERKVVRLRISGEERAGRGPALVELDQMHGSDQRDGRSAVAGDGHGSKMRSGITKPSRQGGSVGMRGRLWTDSNERALNKERLGK
jgi:hypothetical protein